MKRVKKAITGWALTLCALLTASIGWAADFEYSAVRNVLMPNAVQITDEYGNPISVIRMKGGERRRVYVEAVDFAKNGIEDDYSLKPISLTVSLNIPASDDISTSLLLQQSPEYRVLFENEVDKVLAQEYGYLGFISSNLETLDVAAERSQVLRTRRRLHELHVTAQQQLGDAESNYNEQKGTIQYALRFGRKSELNENERPAGALEQKAPVLQVFVQPSDQGGRGGDNGGGSCDTLALGAASLLVPGLLLRRRTKQADDKK